MQVADPVQVPVQPFAPPKIGSRLVHWYPHADRSGKPSPALLQSVTPYGDRTLTVLPLNSTVPRTRHRVLDVNDPRLKNLDDAAITNGGWDLTPEDRDM